MKRILVIFAVIAWFAGPLAAQAPAGTLEQITKTGKIRIGYRKDQPPMSFLGRGGTPEGYTIDICNRIADGIKIESGKAVAIEYIHVNAEDRFDALVNNKIDILCGSTTKTLSRAKKVDFTQLTFVTGASLMTMKETGIHDLSGLRGKKIGVVRDTTTAEVLKKMLRDTLTDAEIVKLDSTEEGVRALHSGTIAAFSSDQVVLIGLVIASGETNKYTVASDVFSYEPLALAVRRNDADFRLEVDRVLSHLYGSGLILPIYQKWFGRFSEKRPPIFDALYGLNATPE